MQDYEKLGVFYLGRNYDMDARAVHPSLLLYDSRDLLTHAVCVGMTGSGKTGLCLSLIEEAAIDGVPAILIDPKGDLGNLMLTFPDLNASAFQPWVNADEARNKGLSVEAFAEQEAAKWREGLAQWDQDGARIQRLRDAAEFAIYTPASSAGRPISVLRSFAAPPEEIRKQSCQHGFALVCMRAILMALVFSMVARRATCTEAVSPRGARARVLPLLTTTMMGTSTCRYK